MNKVALITGIGGQDGIYLSKFLEKKGYDVHGIQRTFSPVNDEFMGDLNNTGKINECNIHYSDLTDVSNLAGIIKKVKPDEIYNLAAQSSVKTSFERPEYTSNINALGTLRLLEIIRLLKLEKKTKFFQASTSELFGKTQEVPQKENTPIYPLNPYAISKLYAHWITINYRESYGIFACNGILFNHESPIRGEKFVTRKITMGAARIKKGLQEKLYLGNLNAKRDWGFAGDYVEAMWLMLQQEKPDDYVIATGTTHSVREFVELAFKEVGLDIAWEGTGINEVGRDAKTDKILVEVKSDFYRPIDSRMLVGDPMKAKDKLGWKPKVSFEELVKMMAKNDMGLLQ